MGHNNEVIFEKLLPGGHCPLMPPPRGDAPGAAFNRVKKSNRNRSLRTDNQPHPCIWFDLIANSLN